MKKKQFHYTLVAYLLGTLVYIVYFSLRHSILMLGFGIATIFMLAYTFLFFKNHK